MSRLGGCLAWGGFTLKKIIEKQEVTTNYKSKAGWNPGTSLRIPPNDDFIWC